MTMTRVFTSILGSILVSFFMPLASAAESVVLSGGVRAISCTADCGNCCGSYLLEDTSGKIRLTVGRSKPGLLGIADKEGVVRFKGSFYETTGSCGINQCTMFEIEEVGDTSISHTVYDAQRDELKIPTATITGRDELFEVTLKGPFDIKEIASIGKGMFALQGESCAASTALQCTAGTSCLRYNGIAGASGPQFSTCEISCAEPDSQCPGGQACVTISDGPGPVCQALP